MSRTAGHANGEGSKNSDRHGQPLDIWRETPSRLENVKPAAEFFSYEGHDQRLYPLGDELLGVPAQSTEKAFEHFSRITISTTRDSVRIASLICERLNHGRQHYLGGDEGAGVHFWKASYEGSLPREAYEAMLRSAVRKLCPSTSEDITRPQQCTARVRVDHVDKRAVRYWAARMLLRGARVSFRRGEGSIRIRAPQTST